LVQGFVFKKKLMMTVLGISHMWNYFTFDHPATAFRLMCATAGASTNVVDLYNTTTGAWSTAQLSASRHSIAATSVGNFAIFAGGGYYTSTVLSSRIRYLITSDC
jgi:hypothetical protein